jgi:disulfide bond formation protein DsbB
MTALAKARLLALATPALLLAGAYGSQIWGGLYPCEMCWWQRYAHFAALALALLAFAAARSPAVSRALTLLAGLAILTGGAIGAFHAGVEYHWWEGLTTCSTMGTLSGSNADMLRDLFAKPLIRCDQAQWTLFGISLAGWDALFSIPAAIVVLWLLLHRPRR